MIVRALTAAAFVAVAASSAFAQQTPAERGKYLVTTIMSCQNCHTSKGERGAPVFARDLAGGLSWDEPPFKVTASNITQDKAHGIGNWTDAEIKATLRTGKRPTGVQLAEVMPTSFYGIITDNDLNAIVAYLRTVKPIDATVPDPVYKIALPHFPVPGTEKAFTEADMADPVKKGFYLASIGHCFECHTPFGPRGRDFVNSYGKGGAEFPGPWGVSTSRNITSSKTKGLGDWTDAEIKRAITQGISRDGSHLKPPMGFEFYANMTDGDLNALIAYLRTVPAKE